MRDNHDSTKKQGQIDNLAQKTKLQKSLYPDKTVIAIFYFIDPNVKKNFKFYTEELKNKVKQKWFDGQRIFYGDEIFIDFGLKDKWDKTKKMLIEFNKEVKETNFIRQTIIKNVRKWTTSKIKEMMLNLFDNTNDKKA
ncbi:hypothetical protein EG856_02915 [Mycoplasmopsis phocirhinis]|uniref:Uncharacterized protein n=1 Tax=Mycoplasmopsis phocirhinis TaxID=142650 RepID=A0A4P6MMU3_9BACT|nr:hypothetical protein [Mycoplasmopsis phocirhinis]QBF34848.1 hypothetical protein EG856_02915 [Mycoplasmopsis phocirhinis]